MTDQSRATFIAASADMQADLAGGILGKAVWTVGEDWQVVAQVRRTSAGLVFGDLEITHIDEEIVDLDVVPRAFPERGLSGTLLRQIRFAEALADVRAQLIQTERKLIGGGAADDVELKQLGAPPVDDDRRRQLHQWALEDGLHGELGSTQRNYVEWLTATAKAARECEESHTGRGVSEDHYRWVALTYLRLQADGVGYGIKSRIGEEFEEVAGWQPASETVRDWIAKARRKGYLTAGIPGRAGAAPGPLLIDDTTAPEGRR